MSPGVGAAICFVLGCYAGRFALRCADRFVRDETLLHAGEPESPGLVPRLKFELAVSWRSVRSTWGDALRFTPRERALVASLRPWHHLPLVGRWLPGNAYRCGSTGAESQRWGVEVLTASLFAAVAYVDLSGWVVPSAEPLRAAMPTDAATPWCLLFGHLVLLWALMVATVTDLDTMTIPDGSTVPAGLFAILWATATGRLIPVPVWFEDPSFGDLLLRGVATEPGAAVAVPGWIAALPYLHGFVGSVIGLLVGGGIVWLVRVLGGWALGREAMGFGDVILLAMVGAFLGWQVTAAVFFLAPACACVGLVLVFALRPSAEFPYGPALAGGAVLMLLAWPWVWPAVERACLLGPVLIAVAGAMTAVFAVLLLLVRWGKRLAGLEEAWFDEPAAANVPRRAVSGRWGRGDGWPGVMAATGRVRFETWRSGT